MAHVEEIIAQNLHQIACIIIEPVAGNMGCISPAPGFLEGLRALCDAHQILLIFDEVMTGFRLAPGGVQELKNVRADIVTFGKVIGGGLPVGAFAANTDIMSYLAPLGPVYQAGTLSGNPLAMAAGFAMLSELNQRREIFTSLDQKTKYLHKGLSQVFTSRGVAHTINREQSMISVHFSHRPVTDFETAAEAASNGMFNKFFHGMLDQGIYIAPSAYETWFLTDALTYKDLDQTINAADHAAKLLT